VVVVICCCFLLFLVEAQEVGFSLTGGVLGIVISILWVSSSCYCCCVVAIVVVTRSLLVLVVVLVPSISTVQQTVRTVKHKGGPAMGMAQTHYRPWQIHGTVAGPTGTADAKTALFKSSTDSVRMEHPVLAVRPSMPMAAIPIQFHFCHPPCYYYYYRYYCCCYYYSRSLQWLA
jgi:hypothetical protein